MIDCDALQYRFVRRSIVGWSNNQWLFDIHLCTELCMWQVICCYIEQHMSLIRGGGMWRFPVVVLVWRHEVLLTNFFASWMVKATDWLAVDLAIVASCDWLWGPLAWRIKGVARKTGGRERGEEKRGDTAERTALVCVHREKGVGAKSWRTAGLAECEAGVRPDSCETRSQRGASGVTRGEREPAHSSAVFGDVRGRLCEFELFICFFVVILSCVNCILYYWPVSYTHLTLPTKRIV